MGFAEKSDPATGRKLNLDQTYRDVDQAGRRFMRV